MLHRETLVSEKKGKKGKIKGRKKEKMSVGLREMSLFSLVDLVALFGATGGRTKGFLDAKQALSLSYALKPSLGLWDLSVEDITAK